MTKLDPVQFKAEYEAEYLRTTGRVCELIPVKGGWWLITTSEGIDSRWRKSAMIKALATLKKRPDHNANPVKPVVQQPRYQHICARCEFLGTTNYTAPQSGPKEADLYVCPYADDISTSIIARFSDHPGDYASVSVDILETRYLTNTPTEFSTAAPALLAGYAIWMLRKGGKG